MDQNVFHSGLKQFQFDHWIKICVFVTKTVSILPLDQNVFHSKLILLMGSVEDQNVFHSILNCTG